MTITEDGFVSSCQSRGRVDLPAFSGTRIMMMPLILGDLSSVPEFLNHYKPTLQALFNLGGNKGRVGYLTIDEKIVTSGSTHRRQGLHVDGIYQGRAGGWGGGGGGWGSAGNGMLTVSSVAGCKAWNQQFVGWPGQEGECEHLKDQCQDATELLFSANEVFWVDGLCVHESVPMSQNTPRQFVRLSLPSDGPWFEGYTENPLGIKPSAEILPRRQFMDIV